jgi:predicted nucleic acid-binding protein
MEYLADTVTIIRYFSGDGKIGAQALEIMEEADEGQHVILVSALTLAEILYLSEKNRIGNVSLRVIPRTVYLILDVF